MSEFDEAYLANRSVYGAPYPAVIDYVGGRPAGRLLDVGCGQGRNAVPLAARGHVVTAVDGSLVGVRQTVRAAAARGLAVWGIVADLTTFPVRGRYDLALLDMVLHALPDDGRRLALLAAVRSAIEPGGAVFVVVPEPGPLVDLVAASLSPWTTIVREVTHSLPEGEHKGEYSFVAVIGERSADRI